MRLKISNIASSEESVPSRSSVAGKTGSTFHSLTFVRPLSHNFSTCSLVRRSFLGMMTCPASSMISSAIRRPLTSSSTRSNSSSTPPNVLSNSVLSLRPKAFSNTVAGTLRRLSIFTDKTSPGVRSNSSQAPLSGIILALHTSCPGEPDSMLKYTPAERAS